MFRAAAFVTLAAVFAWLMPLGAFIKPSQEETACGGRRAFHMCSMGEGSAPDGYSLKVGLQNAPSYTGKPSPGSGGDEFLCVLPSEESEVSTRFRAFEPLIPDLLFIRPFEHVPKA